MKKYKSIEVTEKQLEDLVRQGCDLIEDGLKYIDHQRKTDRGPLDVLMVDSGKSLVVAELKIVEDDSMLLQGIDYYDYLNRNLEAIARVYKNFHVDPNQPIRLFLIAPSFSVNLINRCKWIDIPISLFTVKCIALENSDEITPIFTEINLPSAPEVVETYNLNDRLNHITNTNLRNLAERFLKEIQSWDKANILIEPIKYDISLKKSGKVFAYFAPRRKFFMIYTYNHDGKWTGYPVNEENDLDPIRELLQDNLK